MLITKRKPTMPGVILLEEFMLPYGLSQSELARLIGIARRRVNEIILGKRAITPDTALRLAKIFNTSPEIWLNLQLKTDLWLVANQTAVNKDIAKIKPLLACHKLHEACE